MAVSSCCGSLPGGFRSPSISHPTHSSSFEARSSDPDFSGNPRASENPNPGRKRGCCGGGARVSSSSPTLLRRRGYGLSSSLLLRFPPNFVRQLSTKARRNCSNIGVAQIVAASWSNGGLSDTPIPAFAADDAMVAIPEVESSPAADGTLVLGGGVACNNASSINDVRSSSEYSSSLPLSDPRADSKKADPAAPLFSSDGSLAVHAGERLGRGIVTDGITTPIVNTSAYWFKSSAELIDFKEGRHRSFEYGRYGNPTTNVLEEKMSALEKAESTLYVSSGMYASVAMLSALVPAGGHIVTTTDCYRKTRIFIQNELPKMEISATVIDPADMDSLKHALDRNNVSLFFTESPTNPLFRCVDIELVSQLCHSKRALVCIDGTFASPINQKALTLGADIVLHSATKFIAGHNDVLAGCISGSEELISRVRQYHHVVGGVLNPNAAYMILRGMKTLHLRIRQQNLTALRMAQFLEEHPKIIRVYYPGLQSHPEHHIAKRQMTGFGGVVSFEVAGDLNTTMKFVDNLKIPYLAPSFGGCESIVDQPAIMSYWDLCQAERVKYGIKDNLVRFSFGVEDFEDLKADILQALEYV